MAKKSLFGKPESKAPTTFVHCAHDLCEQPSICSVILKTGRTNFCRFHYDQHYHLQAEQSLRDKGLTTVAHMRAYCKANLGVIRAPGNWWAYEIRDKDRQGERLSYAQLEMAIRACRDDWLTDRPYASAHQPQRVPGEDDE